MYLLQKTIRLIFAVLVLSSCNRSGITTNKSISNRSISKQKYISYPQTDVSAISTEYLDEVFSEKEVTEMCRFPTCEGKQLAVEERKKCAEQDMLMFIYRNLKYPAKARENGVQGQVLLDFIVTSTGRIRSAKIVKDPGSDIGGASLDVLAEMDRNHTWIPATINGKPVGVNYILPIKFKLEG